MFRLLISVYLFYLFITVSRGRFFRSLIDLVDGIIIFASFAVDMVFVFISKGHSCAAKDGEDFAK